MATLSTDRMNRALLARHGEPVVLPGAVEVLGIFDLYGVPPGFTLGSEVGLALRMDQQPNPAVALSDAVTVALSVGDPVQVRGVDYVVSAPVEHDGRGMSRVLLMAPPELG